MTPKVLVSDKLSPQGLAVLQAVPSVLSVDVRVGLDPAALLQIIPEYDGLVIRSATKVTPAVLAAASRLKVVGRAGIGVDNVDLAAASARGVRVMNTPDGNVVTTAEHALALMFAVARKIPQATASMRAGAWEKTKFQGRELFGKTIGIIGLGNIGRIVADRARGLRMRVIATDPWVTPRKGQELGVEMVDLDTLLATADVVTLHVPAVDWTKGILGAANVAKLKKGAILINAARGGLVDERAVAAAVQSGQLYGAAFDVFAEEPLAKDSPLLGVDNIVLTPHLGASTDEAQDIVAVMVAEQIVEYFRTGKARNVVNP
jgi:D-3-phosphoglycerate dehydrogenase